MSLDCGATGIRGSREGSSDFAQATESIWYVPFRWILGFDECGGCCAMSGPIFPIVLLLAFRPSRVIEDASDEAEHVLRLCQARREAFAFFFRVVKFDDS